MTTEPARNPSGLRERFDVGSELARPSWRSPRRMLRSWFWQTVGVSISLGVAIWLIPSLTASTWWSVVVAAILVGVFGALLNPLLARLAVILGWVGVGLLALFAEVLVVYVALATAPGLSGDGFWDAFLASWVVAIVGQALGWLTQDDEGNLFLAEVIRRGLRDAPPPPTDGRTGVVFVQMDGVSYPLLEWALRAGNVPTLNRWVRSGSHVTREWTTRLPSTTPVSQAGILHGRSDDMPAFRWYEKDLRRLIVANAPRDATFIESRLTDGRGLLADDGVSVSNLFSGDAPLSLLTMSSVGAGRPGGKPADFVSFFATPYGFGRALTRTVAEMVKEIYQARRQVRQRVEPRVPRHGFYVVLRGFTNVLQRDLNVVLVAEQMMRGVKSVYVDFLDYDEIAHHAGIARPESLAAVQGIDAVLGRLEAVARYAPRDYEFVILSDHGQSQGSTFLQRHGERLEDVVRRLMGGAADVVAATGKDEDYGPLNAFLSSLAGGGTVGARMTKGALAGKVEDDVVQLGPGPDAADDLEPTSELVVAGSGNLGLVWFPQHPGRVTLERMESLWPGLAGALAAHPGTSFVMVRSEERGPVALGAGGVRVLRTGEVEGQDPLAPFDDHLVDDLLRLDGFANAADVYVNSVFDPETGEVAAFEELVGCHGGTGGWQTRPMLVHPAHWPVDDERLYGAEAVHAQLVRWLERLGHRADLPPAPAAAAEASADHVADAGAGRVADSAP